MSTDIIKVFMKQHTRVIGDLKRRKIHLVRHGKNLTMDEAKMELYNHIVNASTETPHKLTTSDGKQLTVSVVDANFVWNYS